MEILGYVAIGAIVLATIIGFALLVALADGMGR